MNFGHLKPDIPMLPRLFISLSVSVWNTLYVNVLIYLQTSVSQSDCVDERRDLRLEHLQCHLTGKKEFIEIEIVCL